MCFIVLLFCSRLYENLSSQPKWLIGTSPLPPGPRSSQAALWNGQVAKLKPFSPLYVSVLISIVCFTYQSLRMFKVLATPRIFWNLLGNDMAGGALLDLLHVKSNSRLACNSTRLIIPSPSSYSKKLLIKLTLAVSLLLGPLQYRLPRPATVAPDWEMEGFQVDKCTNCHKLQSEAKLPCKHCKTDS